MSEQALRNRYVRSGDVDLYVVEAGEPGRPPLLLLHGFPDDHEMYRPMIDELSRDFHVASFDMRGVGRSSPPKKRTGYRVEALLPDVTAVIDAVFGPHAKAHLVGHDWGSIVAFSYVADPVLQRRVQSFTSVSGPHLGVMWDANLRHLRSLRPREVKLGLAQLASSWYALFLQLPLLPEWLIARRGVEIFRGTLRRGGVKRADPYLKASQAEVWSRMHNALELYRQNVLRPPAVPPKGSITVPTCLVIALRDPFVRPGTFDFMREYVPTLTVHELDASHWAPRSHPLELAELVRAQATRSQAPAVHAPSAS
jgi:pimeloyl-ACP methyl ester carboxylesterase